MANDKLRLIVGLGNPGSQYQYTRHNVGWQILDYFQAHSNWANWQQSKKLQSLVAKDERGILLKPQTYMNNSGQAVQSLSRYFRIPASAVMVIHDDVDLPFGVIRTRTARNGSGGHKGVESIMKQLGPEFYSLRFGIGRPIEKIETDRFVLQKFSWRERFQINKALPKAKDLIDSFLAGQPQDQTVKANK